MSLSIDARDEFFIFADAQKNLINSISIEIEFIKPDHSTWVESFSLKENILNINNSREDERYVRSLKVFVDETPHDSFLLFPISENEFKEITETVDKRRIQNKSLLRFAMLQLIRYHIINKNKNEFLKLHSGYIINSFSILTYKSIELSLRIPTDIVKFFLKFDFTENFKSDTGRVQSTRKDSRQSFLSLKSSLWHACIFLGIFSEADELLEEIYSISLLDNFDQISFSYNISNAIFILSYVNYVRGNLEKSKIYAEQMYSFFIKISNRLPENKFSYGKFIDLIKLSKLTGDSLLLLERIEKNSARSQSLNNEYVYSNTVRAKSPLMKTMFHDYLESHK